MPKETINKDNETAEGQDQKPYYQKSTTDVQNQHLKKMLAVQQSKTGMTKKQQQNTNSKFNRSELVVDLNATRK